MQSIDFISGKPAHIDNLNDLKPRELLYLRLQSMNRLDIVHKIFIKKACQITSEVILSVPFEDYKNKDSRKALLDLGVKGFALRVKYSPSSDGDAVLVETFKLFYDLLPVGKILVLEIECGEDIRGLATTIADIHAKECPYVILNVEETPSDSRVQEFKNVFEKLKIRGCTRLNVYFPFWLQTAAEWDIKTQNTYAGLHYVHIDISNRCTHSCEFCGLYGQDAVFEMKMRGGGSMPNELSQFMKQEIKPEKCLEIIESLPWTVDSIQFGGVGDPLMHEHAVSFIAAARERGFKTEILSNMEYLEEEQIQKLHKLGGKTVHDLHFIANISGGSPEVYLKTRPKQTEKSFNKVIDNLIRFSELRKNESVLTGAAVTLMCIVTKNNCLSLFEVAELAKKIGATRLWFKPLEVHSAHHEKIVPQPEMMKKVAEGMQQCLKFAEANNITIVQRDYCESIIQNSGLKTHE
jgi:wyosine [tRNA(Phe)-imidazoG37] synthetase (radical SAM superfamily)